MALRSYKNMVFSPVFQPHVFALEHHCSAKLVQIGTIPLIRNEPPTTYPIEDEITEVVRVLVFRDELTMTWTEFLNNPAVKQLLQWIPTWTMHCISLPACFRLGQPNKH